MKNLHAIKFNGGMWAGMALCSVWKVVQLGCTIDVVCLNKLLKRNNKYKFMDL